MLCADGEASCPIFLTISPVARHLRDPPLEINWGPNCESPPQRIGLFAADPSTSNDPPLLSVFTEGRSCGFFRTNIGAGSLDLPGGWNPDEASVGVPNRITVKCLPFYLASFDGDRQLASDCLKIRPNWMSAEAHLERIPLSKLFVPGTHCSGCYSSRRSHTNSIILKRFGFVQSLDVWTQLVFGVRYLDISIG